MDALYLAWETEIACHYL